MTILALATSLPVVSAAAHCVEVITSLEAFLALEPVWTALAEEAHLDHPFVGHDWMRTWWESFGRGRQLHIVVVRDQSGAVAAIVPLMWTACHMYGVPVRRLEAMANEHTPRFDFLIRRPADDVCRAIWHHLAHETHGWDVLQLRQLPLGSRVLLELPEHARNDGFLSGRWAAENSPYIPISSSWTRYCETLRTKHRSNLRNRFKRLRATGPVVFETLDSAESLDEGLALEAAAWKGAAGTAIDCSSDVRSFYDGLARRMAGRGALRLQFLSVAGCRIAFHYALRCGGKQYLLKPGYDPAFSAYSPTNLLCSLALEKAFDEGLSEYEFLGGVEDWKRQWAPCARPHEWLFVFPNTLRGRLLYNLKFELLPRLHRRPFYRFVRGAAVGAGFHA